MYSESENMKNHGFAVILNICFFMTAIMLNKNFEATIGKNIIYEEPQI